jgi:mRNA interferase MazF
MGSPVAGDVVVAWFPFSDLSATKKRPAIVLATLPGDDVILCQITSQPTRDPYAIDLLEQDYTAGGLRQQSYARPNRLFTAEQAIIAYRAGTLTPTKLREIRAVVIKLLQS